MDPSGRARTEINFESGGRRISRVTAPRMTTGNMGVGRKEDVTEGGGDCEFFRVREKIRRNGGGSIRVNAESKVAEGSANS